jgi:hypothetical protein
VTCLMKGSWKRHPRVFGFDDLIRDLRWPCISFEDSNAEDGDLNLGVGFLCDIYGGVC